jgi:DNA-binding transcriptional LysR family regulator
VTGAAQALGIAQPALSQAITRMERERGVKLVERRRRGAALTTAGAAIVDDIRLGVSRIDAAEKRARDIGAKLGGRLTVGFASTALFDVLPRSMAVLRAQVPGVELVLKEMSNAEKAATLEEGCIDLGLLHTPVAVGGKMREKLIVRKRMLAVMPLAHPVSEDGKVSLRELADLGLVWFPHDQLPVIRAGILSAFRKAGCEANVVQHANRSLTVLACVRRHHPAVTYCLPEASCWLRSARNWIRPSIPLSLILSLNCCRYVWTSQTPSTFRSYNRQPCGVLYSR